MVAMPAQLSETLDFKGKPSHSAVSLKVIIVGAGIGGLTAAIALRKHDHEVHIYEHSQLANEIGAAIHIVPNANSTLRRMGINHEERGAIKLLQTRYYNSNCDLLSRNDNEAESHRWQDTWLQAHRGHFHTHLKDIATSAEGDGPPARIYTSSRVTNVDPQEATITLENGDVVQGDVVVGADGVRSVCRRGVAGPKYDSFPFGKSAFRFMVPRAKILEDPETRELGESLGSLDMFFSPENKVIVYPCVNNTLFNIVCIHPAHLSDASADTYNKSVSKEKLLEVFHDFNPKLIKIFEKCDCDTLKVWPLFDAPNMPTFVKDRLALIGDAAHAFTPFIGQGGAMAIEDAVSLGVMLSRGVTLAGIPERLELYNLARHERATTIQGYSRMAGGDGVKPGQENAARLKGREHAFFALSHDEYHASSQILREHEWEKIRNPLWHQPLVFGPMPGHQQDSLGDNGRAGTKAATTVNANIKFKTSATLLRNLFPNKSYSFVAKDTIAFASVSVVSYRNVKWLGFHGFDQVSLEIHGVKYTKPDGSVIHGRYIPVMFQNCADAISAGRERFGYPTIFSEIDVDTSIENSYSVNLSWKGVKWATVSLKDLKTTESSCGVSECPSLSEEGVFVHKYIPATTDEPAKSKYDVSEDIFIPDTPPHDNSINFENGDEAGQNGVKVSPKERPSKVSSNAGFDFTPHSEQELPTLYPFVHRLAEIPVFEIVNASVREAEVGMDQSKAHQIS